MNPVLMNISSIPHIYNQSLALLTDMYQLTMAYGYWKNGMEKKEAVFHLSFRRSPFHGGYTVAAGLEYLIDFIEKFKFDVTDIEYLSTLTGVEGDRLFPDTFLNYLLQLKFTCNVDAIPEGTIVFPHEPLVRVQGPLIQCQLLESSLLNLINFSTLIATKAARIRTAANGDHVLEFGLRRAQGIDGALTASRAAYVGGCDATSNVLAGKLFGIPVKGTHSHSWVMAFDDEEESFKAFANAYPSDSVFLVDTYNSIDAIKKSIEIGLILKSKGKKLLGIRLDSGDLAYLSIQARKMLDEAGLNDTKIYASNELDETVITELRRQNARIQVWGVGTNLVTAKDQPALDGVYKLSAIRDPGGPWKNKLKLSEQLLKISNPGILQVRRFYISEGNIADMIFDLNQEDQSNNLMVDPFDATREREIKKEWEYHDLLVPIFRDGERVYDLPSLKDIRQHTITNLSKFHPSIKRFLNPHQYIVGMEKSLYQSKVKIIRSIRSKIGTQH